MSIFPIYNSNTKIYCLNLFYFLSQNENCYDEKMKNYIEKWNLNELKTYDIKNRFQAPILPRSIKTNKIEK